MLKMSFWYELIVAKSNEITVLGLAFLGKIKRNEAGKLKCKSYVFTFSFTYFS